MTKSTEWPRVRQRADGRWIVDCGFVNGKRRQYSRATQDLAEGKADELRAERDRVGVAAFDLTTKQRLEAAECFEKLAGVATLTDAVNYFLETRGSCTNAVTVEQLYKDLMKSQEDRGLSKRSIYSTRCQLKPFAKSFGKTQVADIPFTEIRKWLEAQRIKNPTTKSKLIRYLSQLFQFAVREEIISANPVTKIDRPKVKYALPETLIPDDVKKIMLAANEHDPQLIPKFAIGFFAGLRTCELDQLDWSGVKLEDRIITVLHTKTSSGNAQSIPRHVTISDNLVEWLLPHRQPAGLIGLKTKAFNVRRQEVCKKAKVEKWPHNAMRHSFATYHLAAGGSAEKTALELGHMQGTKVLFRHYRGLATRKEAEAYWGIRPAQGEAQNELLAV